MCLRLRGWRLMGGGCRGAVAVFGFLRVLSAALA